MLILTECKQVICDAVWVQWYILIFEWLYPDILQGRSPPAARVMGRVGKQVAIQRRRQVRFLIPFKSGLFFNAGGLED